MSRTNRTKGVQPEYPTREALLVAPEVLREHMPAGWKKMLAAGGVAVVFTVAGLAALPAGCTRDTGGAGAAIVAPIFEHGDGRAATGCVVISPPVFISEEEARQIITEELGKAGLHMTQKDVSMKDVPIRPRTIKVVEKEGKEVEVVDHGKAAPLVADLVDPEKGVAVEFVSQEDHGHLVQEEMLSTVEEYDFKAVGRDVAEQIRAKRSTYRFGVFYDPAGHADLKAPAGATTEGKTEEERGKLFVESYRAGQEAAEKGARENLREQVRDFAAWLKQQGVI